MSKDRVEIAIPGDQMSPRSRRILRDCFPKDVAEIMTLDQWVNFAIGLSKADLLAKPGCGDRLAWEIMEWRQEQIVKRATMQPLISDKYVRHEDGRRGVIIKENETDWQHRVVVCDTGEEELWHFQMIYWLYLIPRESW